MMQLPLGVASPRLAPSTEQEVAEAFHAAYPSMLGPRGEAGPDLAGGTARVAPRSVRRQPVAVVGRPEVDRARVPALPVAGRAP